MIEIVLSISTRTASRVTPACNKIVDQHAQFATDFFRLRGLGFRKSAGHDQRFRHGMFVHIERTGHQTVTPPLGAIDVLVPQPAFLKLPGSCARLPTVS